MSSSSSYVSDESESFSSFQADFERLSEMLQNFASDVDTLETNLIKIQKPIENIEISKLANCDYLENSSFRKQSFLIKAPGIVGFSPEKRYPFKDICTGLRNYLFQNNLVKANGTIILNEPLKALFKLNDSPDFTYLDLISHLKNVVV